MSTQAVGSVLVVVTRQIGDVLLTTPLIRRARQLWPQARIDVAGFEATLAILRGNPDVNGLVPLEQRPGLKGYLALRRRIWRRYDLALVAEVSDRAHLVGWMAGRRRAGLLPEDGRSNWLKRRLLTHAVTAAGDRGELHVVDEKLQLLAPWETDGTPPTPEVAVPAAQALPAALAAALAPGYVVVHSPSMWTYKEWAREKFSAVIGGLTAIGRQVVLTGGPAQADRERVAALVADHPGGQVLDAGVLSFNQMTTLLAGARLYIGPDTSVSHLAAATGVPVIAIFGPTNPLRWAPWPAHRERPVWFARAMPVQQVGNVTLLQDTLPCVPCGRAGCEDHRDSRSDCLINIGPEAVLAQARALLAAPR